jgi:superfamily II DNA or RNA helicase
MCAEGLDIPGLNAEFLITPKTDIEQIVGRILRAKHPITNPVIYDIKDSHEVFEKQWNKRKSFYKKNNYKIIETDSFNYKNINTKWKNIFTPKAISNCDNNLSSESDVESDDEYDFKGKKDPLVGKCLLMLPKKK